MSAELPLTSGEEICPFIVYRLDDQGMECAIWRLTDGRESLALFLDEAKAQAYIESTQLGTDWKPHCPGRNDLLEIIRQSTAAGISLAALDPNGEEAKRLFDLEEVVQKMRPE